MNYQPPVTDIRFLLEQVLDAPGQWAAMQHFDDADSDLLAQVLDEAGKFVGEVVVFHAVEAEKLVRHLVAGKKKK